MTPPRQPSIELPPAPPAAPRALTQKVRRRSLAEPMVRFWWIAGLVLLTLSAYFFVTQMWTWARVLHIVRYGTPVTATITMIGEEETSGRADISPDNQVTLQYQYGGQSYEVVGYLEGRLETISIKENVPIKVDPDSPDHWTYRTDAPPILHGILASMLVLPFAAIAILVSLMLRRRVLRIWQTGTAAPFVVQTTGQSALAPVSRVVTCKPMEAKTARLVHVFIPRHQADPKPGDVLWLIHPPGKPTAVLAAMSYG
jgi:hypothetical protein